jgi:hypothetical protein
MNPSRTLIRGLFSPSLDEQKEACRGLMADGTISRIMTEMLKQRGPESFAGMIGETVQRIVADMLASPAMREACRQTSEFAAATVQGMVRNYVQGDGLRLAQMVSGIPPQWCGLIPIAESSDQLPVVVADGSYVM